MAFNVGMVYYIMRSEKVHWDNGKLRRAHAAAAFSLVFSHVKKSIVTSFRRDGGPIHHIRRFTCPRSCNRVSGKTNSEYEEPCNNVINVFSQTLQSWEYRNKRNGIMMQ